MSGWKDALVRAAEELAAEAGIPFAEAEECVLADEEFAALEAEADIAQEAYQAAQRRSGAATQALVAAQCRAVISVEPSERPGFDRRIECTLRRDHGGSRHENKASGAHSPERVNAAGLHPVAAFEFTNQ